MESFDELGPRFKGMEAFWREEIAPLLDQQEKRRRRNLALLGVVGSVAASFAGAAYFWAPENQVFEVWPLVVGMMIFGAGFGYLQNDLKSREQGWIAGSFEKLGLTYSEESQGFDLRAFASQGVLPNYDRSSLEDHIIGEHQGVPLEIIEAELKEKRTTRTKNGTRTTYVTVFDGLLIRCGFKKSFTGYTLVKRDGGFLTKLFSGRGKYERVRLEDPEFEEAFEVFSDDQVEARYLLQPAFMQRLLDLDRHLGSGSLVLAFSGQQVWIALKRKGDSFRFGSLFKGYSRQGAADFLKGLADIFLLIEQLNARGASGSGLAPAGEGA